MKSRCAAIAAALAALIGASASSTGCSSVTNRSFNETDPVFTRTFFTDFNTAWQAVLDALKNSSLDVSNREGGYVQTRWVDNTSDKNFKDSFGSADTYLKAQYRFKVTVGKGFYQGAEAVRVAVTKEQLVQHDVLEGWVPVETDSIDENTLLYRIGRIVTIRMKLAKLEQDRIKKSLQETPP